MVDVDELSPADRRAFYLRHIRQNLEGVSRNLWPDAYAGGATVHALAQQVGRLCEIVEDMNGGKA